MATQTIPLHVKVLDFGLSRAPKVPVHLELESQPGVAIGTPKYMAPEILSGDIASPGSDIYSLGLILYELATGEYPYSFNSLGDCFRAHLTLEPAPFPTATIPFPPQFELLVLRMLAKEAGMRPTAQECFRTTSRVSTAIDIEKSRRTSQ